MATHTQEPLSPRTCRVTGSPGIDSLADKETDTCKPTNVRYTNQNTTLHDTDYTVQRTRYDQKFKWSSVVICVSGLGWDAITSIEMSNEIWWENTG